MRCAAHLLLNSGARTPETFLIGSVCLVFKFVLQCEPAELHVLHTLQTWVVIFTLNDTAHMVYSKLLCRQRKG